MDFELNTEQKATRDAIRKFMVRECTREAARESDFDGTFPIKLFNRALDLGICALTIPEEYEGVGPDTLGAVIAAEELSTVNPALAAGFMAAAFCGGRNISLLGSGAQKKDFLPELSSGFLLFSYGITESDSDYSFAPSIRTTALIDGDYFVLNGTKSFVRLADRADYLLVLACTDPDAEPDHGLSFFIVNMKSNGISCRKIETVGYRSMGLFDVTFENVRVHKESILGGYTELNRGRAQYDTIMDSENLSIAAASIGIAQGAYDYAANYASERIQFGQPIIRFEAIQQMLVEIAVALRAGRMLLYKASCSADSSISLLDSSIARVYAVQTARQSCLHALQIFGGYGYAMEYDIQRYLRDSLVLLGSARTSQVFEVEISRLLGH